MYNHVKAFVASGNELGNIKKSEIKSYTKSLILPLLISIFYFVFFGYRAVEGASSVGYIIAGVVIVFIVALAVIINQRSLKKLSLYLGLQSGELWRVIVARKVDRNNRVNYLLIIRPDGFSFFSTSRYSGLVSKTPNQIIMPEDLASIEEGLMKSTLVGKRPEITIKTRDGTAVSYLLINPADFKALVASLGLQPQTID